MPGEWDLVGFLIFVGVVAIAVVVGITINDHLQAWVDNSTTSSTAATASG